MTLLSLLYVDAEGALYRGFGRAFPLAVWRPHEQVWELFSDGPKPDGWGRRVSMKEAERCYPGSTVAALPHGLAVEREVTGEEWIELQPELFDSYDGPITRHPPKKT
jgi:hypothetical protein